MKKIVFVILLLSIAVLSAASCGKNDDKVSGGDTVVENNDSSSAEKEGGEEAVYTDGMIIEAYIPFAALYFHDGFNSDDNVVSEKDVFHLTAQFIYTQRSDLISKISPDGTEFCVRGSRNCNGYEL